MDTGHQLDHCTTQRTKLTIAEVLVHTPIRGSLGTLHALSHEGLSFSSYPKNLGDCSLQPSILDWQSS